MFLASSSSKVLLFFTWTEIRKVAGGTTEEGDEEDREGAEGDEEVRKGARIRPPLCFRRRRTGSDG